MEKSFSNNPRKILGESLVLDFEHLKKTNENI